MTNEQRIIELLKKRPGLDDDEIFKGTGVSPRQQVNQICRHLESRSVLRRGIGPKGKIVNTLIESRNRRIF